MNHFRLREVRQDDFPKLCRLAQLLNSVNLPGDENALREVLAQSLASFSGALPPAKREYLIVLEDMDRNEVIGTSMLFAQHGSKEAPHIFLKVQREEHYSGSVDKHFKHTTLRVGYDYEGPTEIGGLVLHPDYRGHQEKLGMQLSFMRFVFIAMRRSWFQDRVLAELLPPFTDDAKSPLWEAFGRHFTDLDYWDADRISRTNKEFVKDLFPSGLIYASLLDRAAQEVIGQVGQKTVPVRKMLERIGFSYSERVDPFDGGPHYEAKTGDITIVKDVVQKKVQTTGELENAPSGPKALLAVLQEDAADGDRFRGCRTSFRLEDENVLISQQTAEVLAVSDGDAVFVLPLKSSAKT